MEIRFTGILTLLLVFMIQFSFSQEKTITGTVTSAEDGLPLPGASVVIEGTTRGMRTDLDGNFSIMAKQGEKLVFSYVGAKTQVITIGASDVINVVLSTDNVLETVELDIYRKITPRTSAVSVKTVSGDVMEERANVSALQGLQGMVAGANIVGGNGQPGATPRIVIRGFSSINGATDPLIVIDGMPVEMNIFRTLNPNDINTYTVLKDAAATSIYGNRGTNGVIVITTKSGKFNQDLRIQYVGQSGFTVMPDLPIKLMNSSQILNFQKKYEDGKGYGMEQWEIDQLAANTNTYWTDILFRTGTTNQHDLSISSGSENSTNYTTLGYVEQEGIVISSEMKRFNLRNNFVGRTKDNKFNYAFNTNVSYVKSNELPGVGTASVNVNPFWMARSGMPYVSPYDPDGSITSEGAYGTMPVDIWEALPILMINRRGLDTYQTSFLRFLSGFNANYEIVKNVNTGVRLSADYMDASSTFIQHPKTINSKYFNFVNKTVYGGTHQENTRKDFNFNALYSLGYSNTFDSKHNLSVSAFFEYNKAHRKSFGFYQRGINPKFVGIEQGLIPGNTLDPGQNPAQRFYIPELYLKIYTEGLVSYFATGSYDFDQKYVFNATVRRDGSFRFTKVNRWGTFWAVGAAWNIDKENFMTDSGFSYLKLRASVGTSGNQRVSSDLPFIDLSLYKNLYSAGIGYDSTTSFVRSQVANIDLVWETTEQINIGIDFGVLNDKLQASIDVYQKTTKDLYNDIPVSAIGAIKSQPGGTDVTNIIKGNVGSMENRGVELDFIYTIVKNKDWKVVANFNGSYNKNKIKKLHESFNGLLELESNNFAFGEGHSLGEYYVNRYIGVNPANGNSLFLDANGNPTERLLNENKVFIGKSFIPTWQGGFGTLVSYKGFEFSTQWMFVADVYIANRDFSSSEDAASMGSSNLNTSLLQAWQTPGDITSVPRVKSLYTGDVETVYEMDKYIEDSSFLRLKNIAIAYQLSKEQLEKMPFTGLRFFVQAENILTFSKYRGQDVEHEFRNIDYGRYPTPKIYTLGMIVNF